MWSPSKGCILLTFSSLVQEWDQTENRGVDLSVTLPSEYLLSIQYAAFDVTYDPLFLCFQC